MKKNSKQDANPKTRHFFKPKEKITPSKKHEEQQLDEALEETFPASDATAKY